MQSHVDNGEITNNFPGIPPFPDDVATAPLLRLSSGKLLAGDSAEYAKLFQASTDIGFFYLDLSDSEQGSSLLGDADTLFKIGENLFELSLDEKKKYDFSGQNSYFGYKAQGAAVVDKQGNLDRNEFYNVSSNQVTPLREYSIIAGQLQSEALENWQTSR
jgi:isopenicillin N synthase-like dioxygenase